MWKVPMLCAALAPPLVLATLAWSTAEAQTRQPPCEVRSKLVERLALNYKETSVATGLAHDGQLFVGTLRAPLQDLDPPAVNPQGTDPRHGDEIAEAEDGYLHASTRGGAFVTLCWCQLICDAASLDARVWLLVRSRSD